MRWMWVLVLGFSLACAYVCVHYDNLNAKKACILERTTKIRGMR